MTLIVKRRSAQRTRVDGLPWYACPAYVGSGRMLLGVALAMASTMALLHPRVAGERLFWWLAGLAFLASVALVVSGLNAIDVPQRAVKRAAVPEPEPGSPAPAEGDASSARRVFPPEMKKVPELEDLLVNHCRLITEQQLAAAKARQRDTGLALGQTLMRMGILTDEDLRRVLAVHAGLRDPWRDAPRHH